MLRSNQIILHYSELCLINSNIQSNSLWVPEHETVRCYELLLQKGQTKCKISHELDITLQ